jgi:hypothetical protein
MKKPGFPEAVIVATAFSMLSVGCSDDAGRENGADASVENGTESTPREHNTSTSRTREQPSSPQELSYDRINAGSFHLNGPISLCELIHRSAGGGVYEVISLTGKTEAVPGSPNKRDGFTYVELALVKSWTPDAPVDPVARIEGGPVFDQNVTSMWFVSLEVGEQIGLLLEPQSSRNRGYYGIEPLDIFRPGPHGGLTNGQLFRDDFISRTDLATMVHTIAEAAPACPVDVVPERPQHSPGTERVERGGIQMSVEGEYL